MLVFKPILKQPCAARFNFVTKNNVIRKKNILNLPRNVKRRMPNPKSTPEKMSGIVFEPFNEVKLELATVDKTNSEIESFARMEDYVPKCEAAINEQINIEYNISYVYHSIFSYFDRDNVALPGLAHFFNEMSIEEREHAEKLMKYQTMRGGKVLLGSINQPEAEFYHKDKGDALYAMELSLSLEKLNYQKLKELWKAADENEDPQMCDFIESEFLNEQVESIKKISEYVSQLRRVGTGHGVFHFDKTLENGHTTTTTAN